MRLCSGRPVRRRARRRGVLRARLAADERRGLVRQPTARTPRRTTRDASRTSSTCSTRPRPGRRQGTEDGYPYSPDHWMHVAPGKHGKLLPRHRARGDRAAQPVAAAVRRGPREGRAGRGRRHRLAPPAAGDTRTPWLARRRRRRREQRPGAARVRRPRHPHRRRSSAASRRRPACASRASPSTASAAAASSSRRWSDPAAAGDAPQAAGDQPVGGRVTRTRLDLPSLASRRFHDRHLKDADCVLVAAAGNDTLAGAVLAGGVRLGHRRRRARPRPARVRLLQLRRSRPTSTRWAATSSTPSPTASTSASRRRTRATSASSGPAWRGGAVRRSRRRSWPA